MFWKDGHSKKIALGYDLSCIMYHLFPENMILFLKRKMKDRFSQKNTCKYYFTRSPPPPN